MGNEATFQQQEIEFQEALLQQEGIICQTQSFLMMMMEQNPNHFVSAQ